MRTAAAILDQQHDQPDSIIFSITLQHWDGVVACFAAEIRQVWGN